MTKTKANDWRNRPISEWNVSTFLAYLSDRHLELYKTEYLPPGRNWQVERGLIGNLIGTKGKNAKPRKYEPAVVKAFIDRCFEVHRCSPQWPTVSFTWLYKWKTDIWAKVVAEDAEAKRRAERAEERANSVEDVGMSAEELDGWL